MTLAGSAAAMARRCLVSTLTEAVPQQVVKLDFAHQASDAVIWVKVIKRNLERAKRNTSRARYAIAWKVREIECV